MGNTQLRMVLLVLMVFCSSHLFGQRTIGKGEVQLNFGFGGNVNGLPMYLGAEYGLSTTLSTGLQLGYFVKSRFEPMTQLVASFNWHLHEFLELPEEWNVYLGMKAATLMRVPLTERKYRGMILGNIGARYYWDELWAVHFDLTVGPGGTGTLLGFSRKVLTQK